MITKQNKQVAISAVARHASDTGSSEVQISVLTARIKELTAHLQQNPNDNHSRRGLIALVEKRKKHLSYLQKTNLESYNAIKSKLDIR